MDCEKRNCLCEFSIETRIDDIDLPNKIKKKINSLDLHIDPEKAYKVSAYFDIEIYNDSLFYTFPVEWKPHELKKLEKIKNNKQETEKTILYGVLGQQIHSICKVLEPFNINFHNADIVGYNIGDINRVDFCISEDNTEPKESKIKLCTVVVPSLMAAFKNMEKALEIFEKEKAKEEFKKAQEKSQHTPNMKCVDEIFISLATAILEDRPDKSTSPEKLSREMILQAQIKNDWPLEIRGSVNAVAKENCVIDVGQIDCPEFFVYVKNKGYWTLNKTATLETAKNIILTQGYNYKGVEQVIVLHNLKNVRFKLFAENKGEIEPISKSKAHTAKNLLLRWIKSRK